MISILFVTGASFLLALMLTRLVRDSSTRLGLVDLPDNRRKTHRTAVPRTGGVAIVAAYLLSFAVLLYTPLSGGGILRAGLPFIWRLLPAMVVMFLTGLLDDLYQIKPWWKLTGQTVAAGLAYAAGLRVADIAGFDHIGWISLPLTIGWLVLCANAFNLIDGMDGLATGVGIVAGVTTLVAAILHGNVPLALATAPLIGALVAFLLYNFNPASIFLGDSGSLLIGFLLGAYGIIWSQKSAAMLGMAAPTMALALPLIEVGLSICRRFLRNEPIFRADRGHIHHRLLDRGFTPRRAALLLYASCSLGAALSLTQSVVRNRAAGAVVLLFAVCACGGIQYLGYIEFKATRRFLWAGLRPILSAHVKLEALERALISAPDLEQCWHILESGARDLGYSRIDARLSGRRFGTVTRHAPKSAFWQMRLSLPHQDFLNITQCENTAEQPVLVIAFAEIVRRLLPVKLQEIAESRGSLVNLAKALEYAEPVPSVREQAVLVHAGRARSRGLADARYAAQYQAGFASQHNSQVSLSAHSGANSRVRLLAQNVPSSSSSLPLQCEAKLSAQYTARSPANFRVDHPARSPANSRTTKVMSSDCGAPSVNPATAS